jgi:hypothetical protein
MTQEHERKTDRTASRKSDKSDKSDKKAGNGSQPEPGVSEAHDQWLPAGHNVNQVQDEPIPASHQDDGRPEPGEESPAPGAGASGPPAGGSR